MANDWFLEEENFTKFFLEASLKSDRERLFESLEVFLKSYAYVFKSDGLSEGTSTLNFPKVPEDFISCLQLHLWTCSCQLGETYDLENVSFANEMVKTLIVFSRSLNNIKLVSANEFLQFILSIFESVRKSDTKNPINHSFMMDAIFYLECIYDPHFVGRRHSLRKQKEGKKIRTDHSSNTDRQTESPTNVLLPSASVHVQIVPFLYDSLMANNIQDNVKVQLVSLFTVIILGDNRNASQVICPATIDILLKTIEKSGPDLLASLLDSISVVVWKIQSFPPEKRQVEVNSIIESCCDIVLQMLNNQALEQSVAIVDQLRFIVDDGPKELQQVLASCGIFKKNFSMIKQALELSDQGLLLSAMKLLGSLLHENLYAKSAFIKEVGYNQLCETLRNCNTFTKEFLEYLICMAVEVESTLDSSQGYSLFFDGYYLKVLLLKNVEMMPLMLKLMVLIKDEELQRWFSSYLLHLCSCLRPNKLLCTQNGVVSCVITILSNLSSNLPPRITGDLFDIFESLASVSMSSADLKRLMQLFEPQKQVELTQWFMKKLVKSITTVASSSELHFNELTYWEFSLPQSGIKVENIGPLTPYGFTLHAWVSFNEATYHVNTFNLFMITTNSGNRVDVFVNEEGVLCVRMSNKKAHQDFLVPDTVIVDGQWHCIDVVHSVTKRPFGQNHLSIYVDEILHVNSSTNFPIYSEVITSCQIGCSSPAPLFHLKPSLSVTGLPEEPITKEFLSSTSTSSAAASSTNQKNASPMWFKWLRSQPRTPNVAQANATVKPAAKTEQFQTTATLIGKVAEVVIFGEALTSDHIEAMYKAGLDLQLRFNVENEVLLSLAQKPIIWFNAKACSDGTCFDLSRHSFNGKVLANQCVVSSIKNLLNSVGGIQVILALFDQSIENNFDGGPGLQEYVDLLRALMTGHVRNQDNFSQCDGMAILGLILRKVDPTLLSKELFGSLQKMLQVISDKVSLYQEMLEFVLFDFRIWNRSDLNIFVDLIDFLYTIVVKDRVFYKKKFGVQYFLDSSFLFLSRHEELDEPTSELLAKIRQGICNILKVYVGKGITCDELQQIFGAMCIGDQMMALDLADLLLHLLETSAKNDQIFLLMFEPGKVELFYVFLSSQKFSIAFKERVTKIIDALLRTNRVNEANKSSLKIVDSDSFQGFIHYMNSTMVSDAVVDHLLDLFFLSEVSSNLNGILHIVQLCATVANIETKIRCIQKIVSVLVMKPSLTKSLLDLPGWSEAFTYLLINKHNNNNNTFVSKRSKHDSESSYTKDGSRTRGLFYTLDSISIEDDSSTNVSSNNSSSTTLSIFRTSTFEDPYATTTKRKFSRQESLNSQDSHSSSLSSSLNLSQSQGSFFASIMQKRDVKLYDVYHYCSYLGLSPKEVGLPMEGTELDKKDELTAFVLLLVYAIAWRSSDGALVDEKLWKIRGQTVVAIELLEGRNDALVNSVEVVRRFYEILIHGAYNDLLHLPISTKPNMLKNIHQMLKMLYYYLSCNQSSLKFSELLIQNIIDLMTVVLTPAVVSDSSQSSFELLELAFLLLFISQQDYKICSVAVAKLHEVICSRASLEIFQKACFILAMLDQALSDSNDGNVVVMLLPIMELFLDKCFDILSLSSSLPDLPHPKKDPRFFNFFKSFQKSQQWQQFISKQIKPSFSQYKANMLDAIEESMKVMMNDCHDELLVSIHRRNRQKQDSIIKFERTYLSVLRNRESEENSRLKVVRAHIKNQGLVTEHKWRLRKKSFTSERGLWPDNKPPEGPLMISTCENYMRMRPKLVYGEVGSNFQRWKKIISRPDQEANLMSELSMLKLSKIEGESNFDDQLNDEEWESITSLESPSPTQTELKDFDKLMSQDCELVTMFETIKGRLDITTSCLVFTNTSSGKPSTSSPQANSGTTSTIDVIRLSLDQLREIHFRRYNLRRSALEFFLINQANYFFNFDKMIRNKIYARIARLGPPNLIYHASRSPAELMKSSGLTQKWVQREISNFEYLMRLNTMSGRTYNDLSQYPVFPWILSDYTSSELNLEDPKIYRDLSWPVGALNPKNRELIKEKYESLLEQPESQRGFHYGTHYSNPPGVMHYLIRLEPFTSFHVQLQGGSFDMADRQFHSIASTWNVLMGSPNDVKELTPEFFYMPEFLLNMNRLDLGNMQGGEKLSDVVLPPWAHSAFDFINKHRMALESDYVSENLHNWIDLIFGYKQQGQEAVDALNVFHYCTYEGVVNVDTIMDETKKASYEGIVNNFGQTPSQLFKEPHPKRLTRSQWISQAAKVDKVFNVLNCPKNLKVFQAQAAPPNEHLIYINIPSTQSLSFVQQWTSNHLIAITSSGLLGIHGWLPYDKNIPSMYTFNPDSSMFNQKTNKKLFAAFCPVTEKTSKLFAVTPDGRLIFSGGHWDNSLRVFNLTKVKQTAHVVCHTDVITCLALDRHGKRLVTGSKDTTCITWEIIYKGSKSENINPTPMKLLCGHLSEVTCVALSWDLDIVVSGSKDGTVNVYSLQDGLFIRSLQPPYIKDWVVSVEHLVLSDLGHTCVYCVHTNVQRSDHHDDKFTLHLYSINGKHLSKESLASAVTGILSCDNLLLVGYKTGEFQIRKLSGLSVEATHSFSAPVSCMTAAAGWSQLLVGLENSALMVFTLNRLSEVK